MKGVDVKQNSCIMRTTSLMECVWEVPRCGHHKLEIDPIFDNLRVSCTDEEFQLLLRKGVYPYEYMDDWEKFGENHLSPTEAFYSKLNLSGISEYDYNHAQRVWSEFRMKVRRDYHDLYLQMDVLLLSTIFETSG